MQTYLFYDIETSGLNKAFNQVLHFAAIRTDLNLQELERYELKVKLNPDIIPAPAATITHRISLKETVNGMSELEAILQIHRWLNTDGTISIGYNTLGYDDEFLRFSFYRHLLPPYTHQFANRCGRMDLYPIAAIYYLFKPEILCWPVVDGLPSLKLERLNAANQFVQGRAHHAMVDVEVTLALARTLFKEHKMWEYVTGYFNKATDEARAKQLPLSALDMPLGIMVDGPVGAKQDYHCQVLYLGQHRYYKNQSLWLRLDIEKLPQTTEASIAENTWVIAKKWGEPGFVLPPKPRFLSRQIGPRQTQVDKNLAWLIQHPELLEKIKMHYQHYTYPTLDGVDAEASLYLNGFLSVEEQDLCKRFHQTTPLEKSLILNHITNPTLQALAIRILGRHFPEVLNELQRQQFNEHLKKIFFPSEHETVIDYKGEQRLTAPTALQEIISLREQTLDAEQHALLHELETYLLQVNNQGFN